MFPTVYCWNHVSMSPTQPSEPPSSSVKRSSSPQTSMSPEEHPLLELREYAYSHTTVRRAFIVWLRCGQRNQFRDVCDYYHRLEAMEDQLSADSRASSRHHEFSLFVNQPPTSPYLQHLFPKLYSSSTLEDQLYKQAQQQKTYRAIKTNDVHKERTHQEIFEASQFFQNSNLKSQGYVQGHYERTVDPNTYRVDEISQQDTLKPNNDFGSQNSKLNANNLTKRDVTDNNTRKQKQQELNKKQIDPETIKSKIYKISYEEIFESSQLFKIEADSKSNAHKQTPQELIKNPAEKKELNIEQGTPQEDILDTSEMIKNYCKEQQIPLRNFLEGFKEYASRCDLNNTVNNMGFYIKRKLIFEELKIELKVNKAKSDQEENDRITMLKYGINRNSYVTEQVPEINKTAMIFKDEEEQFVNGLKKIDLSIKLTENINDSKTVNAISHSSNLEKEVMKCRKI